jgi:hypothetical protein
MKSISDNDIENNVNTNLLQSVPINEPMCGRIIYIFILSSFSIGITLIVSILLISKLSKT